MYFELLILSIIICFCKSTDAAFFVVADSLNVERDVGANSIWHIDAEIGFSKKEIDSTYPDLPVHVIFTNKACGITQHESVNGNKVLCLKLIKFRDTILPSTGVLLTTNTDGLGGGPVYISLWVYDKIKDRFRNVLPEELTVNALGHYTFITSENGGSHLIIANPQNLFEKGLNPEDPQYQGIWAPHYYKIAIYTLTGTNLFIKTSSYISEKKYDPEDEGVIDRELTKIKMRIKNQK